MTKKADLIPVQWAASGGTVRSGAADGPRWDDRRRGALLGAARRTAPGAGTPARTRGRRTAAERRRPLHRPAPTGDAAAPPGALTAADPTAGAAVPPGHPPRPRG